MTDLLFVYGTLTRSAAAVPLGGPERERLWRESCLIGPATIRARLYDFGAYPGLVLAPDAPDAIAHGEVLRLFDAAATFAWLDRYEMIEPGEEETSEYARVVAEVTMSDDDRRRDAHVYVTRCDVSGRAAVAGGRWL